MMMALFGADMEKAVNWGDSHILWVLEMLEELAEQQLA